MLTMSGRCLQTSPCTACYKWMSTCDLSLASISSPSNKISSMRTSLITRRDILLFKPPPFWQKRYSILYNRGQTNHSKISKRSFNVCKSTIESSCAKWMKENRISFVPLSSKPQEKKKKTSRFHLTLKSYGQVIQNKNKVISSCQKDDLPNPKSDLPPFFDFIHG